MLTGSRSWQLLSAVLPAKEAERTGPNAGRGPKVLPPREAGKWPGPPGLLTGAHSPCAPSWGSMVLLFRWKAWGDEATSTLKTCRCSGGGGGGGVHEVLRRPDRSRGEQQGQEQRNNRATTFTQNRVE